MNNMNNYKNGGFECWTCRQVFSSMWGETCNSCRIQEKRHKELVQHEKQKIEAINRIAKK